jgi:hypothetical protein
MKSAAFSISSKFSLKDLPSATFRLYDPGASKLFVMMNL